MNLPNKKGCWNLANNLFVLYPNFLTDILAPESAAAPSSVILLVNAEDVELTDCASIKIGIVDTNSTIILNKMLVIMRGIVSSLSLIFNR